jgi:hypothetical protein
VNKRSILAAAFAAAIAGTVYLSLPSDQIACVQGEVLITEPASVQLHLDGGQAYAFVDHACAAVDAGDELPAGVVATAESALVSVPYPGPDAGALAFYVQGDPRAQFACACSPGADSGCLEPADDGGTRPARLGLTLQPGWSGACVRKPCTEQLGISSWPEVCPQ